MALKGAPELRRRLRAIQGVFRTTGRGWQSATVQAARRRIPHRTGVTAASLRAGKLTGQKATVVGKYTINFIDKGAKEHDEPKRRTKRSKRGANKILRFQAGGQTVFRAKVHKRRQPAHPFKRESAREGLQRVDPLGKVVELWNGAA